MTTTMDFDSPSFYVGDNQALQDKLDLLAMTAPHIIPRLERWRDHDVSINGRIAELDKKISDLRIDNNDATKEIGRLQRHIGYGPNRNDGTHEADIAKIERRIEKRKAEIARLEASKSSGVGSPLGPVLAAIDKATGTLVAVEPVTLPKGETALGALANTSDTLAERKAKRFEVMLTPPSLAEQEDKFLRDVRTRAAEGAPNFANLLKPTSAVRGKAKPRATDDVLPVFGSVRYPIKYIVENGDSRATLDAGALLFWANADVIEAKGLEEIRKLYQPETSMTAQERAATVAAIDAEIASLDYLAGQYAAMAEEQGATVAYRYGASPLSYVGLREA